jgi:hypothetical protein
VFSLWVDETVGSSVLLLLSLNPARFSAQGTARDGLTSHKGVQL